MSVLHRQYSADGERYATVRKLSSGRLVLCLFSSGPFLTPVRSGTEADFGVMLKTASDWCRGDSVVDGLAQLSFH